MFVSMAVTMLGQWFSVLKSDFPFIIQFNPFINFWNGNITNSVIQIKKPGSRKTGRNLIHPGF